jgi:hypothetical protein
LGLSFCWARAKRPVPRISASRAGMMRRVLTIASLECRYLEVAGF